MKYVKIILRNKEFVLETYYLRVKKFDLPAGIVEEGESERFAAKRELLERTGYEIPENKLISKDSIIESKTRYSIFEGNIADAKKIAEPGEKGGYLTKVRWSKMDIKKSK